MKIKLTSLAVVFCLTSCNFAWAEGDPIMSAKKFMDKGQTKAAVIELKNYLQEHPDNIDARLLIGEAYLKAGEGPAASKAFEKARELKIPKEKWILQLGRAYLMQNDTKALIDNLKTDPDMSPNLQAQVLGLIGTAYTRRGSNDKAQQNFDAALKLDPNASEALLGLSLMAAENKDFKKTIEYTDRVIAADPHNLNAWLVKGEALRMSNDAQGAITAFGKAIEETPSDVRARLGRATALITLGKFDEAAKDVDEVQKTSGDVPMGLYLNAIILYNQNKIDEAMEKLVRVQTSMPNYLPVKLLVGTIAFQKGQLETAEKELSEFNKTIPGNLPAAKLLAATRLKANRPQEAIPVLKQVEAQGKDDAQYLSLLGTAYLQSKQFALGNEYLDKATKLDPKAAGIRAQMALGQMATGNMDNAIVELKKAVELDNGMFQAEVMLILAYLQEKKYDEAIVAANQLKEKRKDDPMPENLLGAAYMAKGDAEKAQEHWNNALRIKPEYATAGLNLARLEVSRNNPEGAAKKYDEILKRDPKNLEAYIGLANIAETKKDYGKMEEYLLAAREKNPEAMDPAIMLSRYYQAIGKPLKSLELARDITSKHPDAPAAMSMMAEAQLANNQLPNALLSLKKLVAKAPNNPAYRLEYIQVLKRSGEMNQSVDELKRLVKDFPDYLPGQIATAEIALLDKNYSEASKIAHSLQSKNPNAAIGYKLEGDIQIAQKQYNKGVEAYEKAHKLEPTSGSARRLFIAERTLGENDKAVNFLSQWLKDHDDDPESWLTLAMAYQSMGKLNESLKAYEKCNSLRPNSPIIENNLAWLYQQMGDKRALSLAEKLLPQTDNNPSMMDTVGWIFVQNGKTDKGLTLLKDAALHAPFQTEIRMHLIEALIKADKKPEAKAELEKLLQEKKEFQDRKKAEELLKTL